jgi:hypothetical protein
VLAEKILLAPLLLLRLLLKVMPIHSRLNLVLGL